MKSPVAVAAILALAAAAYGNATEPDGATPPSHLTGALELHCEETLVGSNGCRSHQGAWFAAGETIQ